MAKKTKELDPLFTGQEAEEKQAVATLEPAPEKKEETEDFSNLAIFVWKRMVRKRGYILQPELVKQTERGPIVEEPSINMTVGWGIHITKDEKEIEFFREHPHNTGNGYEGRIMESFEEADPETRKFILRHTFELGSVPNVIHGKLRKYREAMSGG